MQQVAPEEVVGPVFNAELHLDSAFVPNQVSNTASLLGGVDFAIDHLNFVGLDVSHHSDLPHVDLAHEVETIR